MTTNRFLAGVLSCGDLILRSWSLFVAGGLVAAIGIGQLGSSLVAGPLLVLGAVLGALIGVGLHQPLRDRNPCVALRRSAGMPRSVVVVVVGMLANVLAGALVLGGLGVTQDAVWRIDFVLALAAGCFSFGTFFIFAGLYCISRAEDRLRWANFQQKHMWREAAEAAPSNWSPKEVAAIFWPKPRKVAGTVLPERDGTDGRPA